MPEMRMNSLAMNWGPLSEMTRGFNPRKPLFGPFQNDLDIRFRHLLAQIPMNQETAVAVQDAAQVREAEIVL